MKDINSTDFTYDCQSNAAYIYVPNVKGGKRLSAKTIPFNDNILLDFDNDGKLLGIEVLNASENL